MRNPETEVEFLRRMLNRSDCGCLAADCARHGSFVPDELEYVLAVRKGEKPKMPEHVTRAGELLSDYIRDMQQIAGMLGVPMRQEDMRLALLGVQERGDAFVNLLRTVYKSGQLVRPALMDRVKITFEKWGEKL